MRMRIRRRRVGSPGGSPAATDFVQTRPLCVVEVEVI